VLSQLQFLDRFDQSKLVVAYEPAWAIGTGAEPAGADWVVALHAAIEGRLRDAAGAGTAAPVIYGGSVDTTSASELISCPGVDGLFVGRAALAPEILSEIAHTGLASRI
jgi:triosephosphate isomerase